MASAPAIRFFTSFFRARYMLVLVASSICFQCTVFSGGETVVKPRIHKSWYKKSRWHKRVKVGRFQLRVFEKSGVKKVKMKG
jgi:hypothetical protein